MGRFKTLNTFQKGIFLLSVVMILIFSAVYPYVLSRKGFAYHGTILVPHQENGNLIYSGKLRGRAAAFTVFADRRIQFTCGKNDYGPYLVREDPGAVPKSNGMAAQMTGMEIRCGNDLLFRGGVLETEDGAYCLVDDGMTDYDGSGKEADPMSPSLSTLIKLYYGPELTHKGSGLAWFCGVFFCAMTAVTILYADELFRWRMSFRIRDVDCAEPSEWEIGIRYLGWVLSSILALYIFIMGLR